MKSMEMGKTINIEVRYGLSDIMSLGSVEEVGWWQTIVANKITDMEYKGKEKNDN